MTETISLNQELLIDEQLVKDYLLDNPQFFIQHPEILQTVRLPHRERGVVSLVERQQELLRAKVHRLEEEITDLMATARQNEKIFLTFSDLYLQIISATDEVRLYEIMLEILNQKLGLPAIYLKSFVSHGSTFHIEKAQLNALLEHRFNKSSTYFGRLNSEEQQQLFANQPQIRSAALMLLGEDGKTGLVAFGSPDENHFFPSMDTLFLLELGKILALMLEKF